MKNNLIDRPLWDHQVRAIAQAEKWPDMYLAYDMGTGKTRTTVEILRRRYAANGRLMRTLILCPQIVVPNWRQEILNFSKITDNNIVLLRKSEKVRVKKFMDSVGVEGVLVTPRIAVTNYEALQMDELMKLIEEWRPEILVCDEAHVLKSHQSKRAKRLISVARRAQHRYLLSGTPILNSVADVFMQFNILDNGQTFGENFYSFRNRYMQDANSAFTGKANHFAKWEPRPEEFVVLRDKIFRKTLRAVKSECMDLPPLVKQKVNVELSPEQAKMYKEMKHHYVTWVQSKKDGGDPLPVVAQLAITKALRLQQIVTGYTVDDTGGVHYLKNPRLDALEEILEPIVASGQKVIIWAVFKENYKLISARLKEMKVKHVTLTGDDTDHQKQANMKQFREDKETLAIVANQAAGGVGVNLVEAPYAIYYSKNFSLKDDLQSEARNYRGGSHIHSQVTRIDIVCEGTIDELIDEALAGKLDISDKIIDNKFMETL